MTSPAPPAIPTPVTTSQFDRGSREGRRESPLEAAPSSSSAANRTPPGTETGPAGPAATTRRQVARAMTPNSSDNRCGLRRTTWVPRVVDSDTSSLTRATGI